MSLRVRPTLLLRWVVFAVTASVVAALLYFGWSVNGMIGAAVVVAVAWWIDQQFDLLLRVIEWWAVRRARATGEPVSSIWFVDLDEEIKEERRRFHEETENNPTLR